MNFFDRRPRWIQSALIVGVFVILFLYGISNIKDYGRPWDEITEMNILSLNVLEYAKLFLGEDSKIVQKAIWASDIDIYHLADRDHGEAGHYLFLPIAYALRLQQGPNEGGLYQNLSILYGWHIYTFLIFFMSVVAMYLLCTEIFDSWKMGLLSVVFYYFSPRIFGEGHYNNKDIVLLSFVVLMLCFAVRAMCHQKWRDILFFCLFSGLTINTKIIGLALWVLSLGVLAGSLIKSFRQRTGVAKVDFFALLAFLCYAPPILYTIIRANNVILYNGWRHFYFVYGFIVVNASYGVWWLCRRFKPHKNLIKGLLVLCVTSTFVDMTANRSFEYLYFNPAIRLVDNLCYEYEMDYWHVSVWSNLHDFADKFFKEKKLKISLQGAMLFGLEEVENEKFEIVPEEQAEFVYCNTTWPDIRRAYAFGPLVYTYKKFGNDIACIYHRPEAMSCGD